MKKYLFALIKISGFSALWVLLIALQSISVIAEPAFIKGNAAIQRFWRELLLLISTAIVTLVFTRIIEKKKIRINLAHNPIKSSVFGIFAGIEWIGIPIMILSMAGFFHFGAINDIPYLSVWIISTFLNVVMQEYLVRGYIFELLRKEYNLIISITISTLIFTLLHGGAFEAGILAVLNVITMSIFMSLLLVYTKGLLAPIIVHTVWNILGSLLGCVSLADDYPVLINCTLTGGKIISGGIYKLEGSIFALLINAVNIIALIILLGKRRTPS